MEPGPLCIPHVLVTLFENVTVLQFVLLVITSLGMKVFLVTPPNVTLLVALVFELRSWALLIGVVTFSPVFFTKTICNRIYKKKQLNFAYYMHMLSTLTSHFLKRKFVSPYSIINILYFPHPHYIQTDFHPAAYATGTGALSLEVKWLEYEGEGDQSPPYTAKVKKPWSYAG